MENRVFPMNSKEVQGCEYYIATLREVVDEWNTKELNKMKGQTYTIQAIHYNAFQKNYKPFIDKKDGAVANTGNFKHKISRSIIE